MNTTSYTIDEEIHPVIKIMPEGTYINGRKTEPQSIEIELNTEDWISIQDLVEYYVDNH